MGHPRTYLTSYHLAVKDQLNFKEQKCGTQSSSPSKPII